MPRQRHSLLPGDTSRLGPCYLVSGCSWVRNSVKLKAEAGGTVQTRVFGFRVSCDLVRLATSIPMTANLGAELAQTCYMAGLAAKVCRPVNLEFGVGPRRFSLSIRVRCRAAPRIPSKVGTALWYIAAKIPPRDAGTDSGCLPIYLGSVKREGGA